MSPIDELLSDIEADPTSDSAVALGLVMETSQATTAEVAERTLREAFPEVSTGHPTAVEIARITDRLLRLLREGKASTGVLWALGRSQSQAVSLELLTFVRGLLQQPSNPTQDDLAYEALSSLMRLPAVAGTEQLVSLLGEIGPSRAKELANRLLEEHWFSDDESRSEHSANSQTREPTSFAVDSTALVGAVSHGRLTVLTFVLPKAKLWPAWRPVTLKVFNMPRLTARGLFSGRRWSTWWRWGERPFPARVQVFVPLQSDAEHAVFYKVFRYSLESAVQHGTYGDDRISELHLIPTSESDSSPDHGVDALASLSPTGSAAKDSPRAILRIRYEYDREPTADSRGGVRMRTRRDRLVIENVGTEAAENVEVEVEAIGEGQPPNPLFEGPIERIVPKSSVNVLMIVHMGVASQWGVKTRWTEGDTLFEDSQTVTPF